MTDAGALAELADDALLARAREARARGDAPQATLALRLLVWRHEEDVARRVALRVAPDDVDDVAHDVLVRAIDDAFAGAADAPFHAWLQGVVEREAARWRAEVPAGVEAAGDLLAPGTDGAQAGVPPRPRLDGLAEAFAQERREGGEADPREYLARVEPSERTALAGRLDAELVRERHRPWRPDALRRAHEDELGQRVVASLVEGVEAWPALLPRLRERARLDRRGLAVQLADALELAGREADVERRYAAMESGRLGAEDVAERVLEALATLLDTPADVLRRAGTTPGHADRTPPPAGEDLAAPDPVAQLFHGGQWFVS